MSGHSHWSKIKRSKGANDAKRGKVWSKIARKIIIAARSGGGDPAANLSLRYVIDEAKAENMPKGTIENAIAKGTGGLEGANYESCVYEGYAPGGIAFLIDALTNNRARTAPEIRKIFEVAGGSLATSGSVSFQFTQFGIIAIKVESVNEDTLIEKALDAGAEDVKNLGDVYEVYTQPNNFHKVREALIAAKIPIEGSQITNVPNSTISVSGEQIAKINRIIDALEDNEDVQNVSHNADFEE